MIKHITTLLLASLTFFITLSFAPKADAADREGWFHPGVDIAPADSQAASRFVYSTHAGFVTYAGPAPAFMKEKGWMVQIETDLNKDNIPDIKTRYTHLMPNTLMVNDVKYRRFTYSTEFYVEYAALNGGRGVPFGYGPYVARNQLLARMGDSGSPGQLHVQYEIVTARYDNLWSADLDYFSSTCQDSPYINACSDDPLRPGLYFPVNHATGTKVTGPVFVNPGFKNYTGTYPEIAQTFPAPKPEAPGPIQPPDLPFEPAPASPITSVPAPPIGTGQCVTDSSGCAQICVIDGKFWVNNLYGRSETCSCAYTFGDMQVGAPKPGDPGGITQWCFDSAVFPGDSYALCVQDSFGPPPDPVCARIIAPENGAGCPGIPQTILCLDW